MKAMQGPFIDNLEGDCVHSEWFPGCKQPKDNGIPERVWGCYLPGDEPGWYCKLSNCCPGGVHWAECPRIERSFQVCPLCLVEGQVATLKTDPENPDQPYWCPKCDSYWTGRDSLMAKWGTIRRIIE